MTKYGNVEVDTTELDKQVALIKTGKPETVQEFYDWIEEQGWHIGCYVDEGFREQRMAPVSMSPEQMMANFFGIDRDKIEQERRAILDAIRSAD